MTFSAFQGLRAGNLRHRVAIEQQVTETDSSGAVETFWEYVTTVWASIDDVSGRELLLAEQVQSGVSTRIVTRFRPEIEASMRVKHNGVIYNIEAIISDPDSGREYLTLQCSTGLNDG